MLLDDVQVAAVGEPGTQLLSAAGWRPSRSGVVVAATDR
jgi:hypothetical protein